MNFVVTYELSLFAPVEKLSERVRDFSEELI
jgi:hypothetical protein